MGEFDELTEEAKISLVDELTFRGHDTEKISAPVRRYAETPSELLERVQQAPKLRVFFIWSIFGLLFGTLHSALSAGARLRKATK